MSENGYTDAAGVAAHLDMPVRTVDQWRYRKTGPPYFKIGRHVRYRLADVDAWVARQAVERRRAS
ncbi:MAG: helix-turn-helix transcriptional regulator [Acidimicrobiia bacterium]